jgi:hypothetical protein
LSEHGREDSPSDAPVAADARREVSPPNLSPGKDPKPGGDAAEQSSTSPPVATLDK